MCKMGRGKRKSLTFSCCGITLRPALLFPLFCEGQNTNEGQKHFHLFLLAVNSVCSSVSVHTNDLY